MEEAVDVDGAHGRPVLVAEIGKVTWEEHGRVAHHDVESIESRDRLSDDAVDLGADGNVGRQREGMAGILGGKLVERLTASPGHDHVRAGAKEGLRDRQADPASASRDQDDGIGEVKVGVSSHGGAHTPASLADTAGSK